MLVRMNVHALGHDAGQVVDLHKEDADLLLKEGLAEKVTKAEAKKAGAESDEPAAPAA